jgi:hypothetical protein
MVDVTEFACAMWIIFLDVLAQASKQTYIKLSKVPPTRAV